MIIKLAARIENEIWATCMVNGNIGGQARVEGLERMDTRAGWANSKLKVEEGHSKAILAKKTYEQTFGAHEGKSQTHTGGINT